MKEKENFLIYLQSRINFIGSCKELALKYKFEADIINMLDILLTCSSTFLSFVEENRLKSTYLQQFKKELDGAFGYLNSITINSDIADARNRSQLFAFKNNAKIHVQRLEFTFNFFKDLGFFGDNIVAVGANGSGKTELANILKKYINSNGVVISAQKILRLKSFNSITNPATTSQRLKEYQLFDKSGKRDNNNNYQRLNDEFEVIIKHLISTNIWENNRYKKEAQRLYKLGKEIIAPPISTLDLTFEIWNSLIEHREIFCGDGINISVRGNNIEVYDSMQMSDGEKVILFLIAQVLQAPEHGFIVIDEPEMYLHKTILKKLWNRLEHERKDCIFLYLTHDLDFAVSRTNAKKVWIKSFTHPDNWEIEDIPENEIPESLVLELLGSRKNILFCEGKKGSIDEKIYNILFPEYTITPVESCFAAINFTNAFNKMPSVDTKAIGLIDSDYHSKERLEKLEKKNVFSFRLAEAENLLLVEGFLKKLAKQLMVDESSVEKIKKEVIEELTKKKELQASNYVSAKIDYYFKDSNVSKGNTLEAVNQNYQAFASEIKIDNWFTERIAEIEEIITNNDYDNAIAIFNNKGGLQAIVNKHFNISDFQNRAIKLLQTDTATHAYLKAHFPKFLKG